MDRRLFLNGLTVAGVSIFVPREVPTSDVWDWDNISIECGSDGVPLVKTRVHGTSGPCEALQMCLRLVDREVFGCPRCAALVRRVDIGQTGDVFAWLQLHSRTPEVESIDSTRRNDPVRCRIYQSFDASNIWFETVA